MSVAPPKAARAGRAASVVSGMIVATAVIAAAVIATARRRTEKA